MSDTIALQPEFACLFAVTTSQQGYFTTAQARACGYRGNLLNYHVRAGQFQRVYRGVYRLRDYPSSPREEVMATWLAVGKEKAIVSHESALDLLDLSDVIPNEIHLTVPRSLRHPRSLPGVQIHTTTRALRSGDTVVRDGIRLTSPARTIVDAAEAGTAPEQIEMAVRQAIARGLATRSDLELRVQGRSKRVAALVLEALDRSAA
jgi:predicted transcriptional regulator of viral defense system